MISHNPLLKVLKTYGKEEKEDKKTPYEANIIAKKAGRATLKYQTICKAVYAEERKKGATIREAYIIAQKAGRATAEYKATYKAVKTKVRAKQQGATSE